MNKIVVLPAKVLRAQAKTVKLPLSKEDKRICEEMISYIRNSQDPERIEVNEKENIRTGIGIAAPQLGYSKRMFYVLPIEDDGENEFEEFLINPKYVAKSIGHAALERGEGCLSVDEKTYEKGTEGFVKRRYKVTIKGYSYFQKKEVEITKFGYHAIVLQHEMDHLVGKLFVDHLNLKNPWFEDPDMKII